MKTIRRLRQEGGYSIRQLAAMADLHWTTIWKIEKTARLPSLVTLKKLARVLQLSLTDLLTGK